MTLHKIPTTFTTFVPPGWTADFGFAQALRSVDDELPLLRQAAANPSQMVRVEETWNPYEDDEREWVNLSQIFRNPFTVSTTALATERYGGPAVAAVRKEQLSKHLEAIELSLREGVPRRETHYRVDGDGFLHIEELQMMGGTKFYLRRELEPGDQLCLLVLRDLQYVDRNNQGIDGQAGEWLSEISLKVTPDGT